MATVAAGVSKRYGKRRPWVLDQVGLRLEPGSMTVIVGANGSGKSTLLRILAGVTRPSLGEVVSRPTSVGYVPERTPARSRMTARTYLAHMGRLHGLEQKSNRSRSEEIATDLGVAPGLDVPITALSKGNRQKVFLTQALTTSGLVWHRQASSPGSHGRARGW